MVLAIKMFGHQNGILVRSVPDQDGGGVRRRGETVCIKGRREGDADILPGEIETKQAISNLAIIITWRYYNYLGMSETDELELLSFLFLSVSSKDIYFFLSRRLIGDKQAYSFAERGVIEVYLVSVSKHDSTLTYETKEKKKSE